MTDFWDHISNVNFNNEADVETRLVLPLLHSLGYDNDDIASKYPVTFQEGRKPEADFVVFYGPIRNRSTSLIVVEAKAPKESFEDAKGQGESYASNIRTPFLLLTDGISLEIWQLQPTQESERILHTSVKSLSVAVGIPVARYPPHRSQRALLTHWAPPSSTNVKAVTRMGM